MTLNANVVASFVKVSLHIMYVIKNVNNSRTSVMLSIKWGTFHENAERLGKSEERSILLISGERGGGGGAWLLHNLYAGIGRVKLISVAVCIVVQIGHDIGGNFNIHIWVCSRESSLETGKRVVLL